MKVTAVTAYAVKADTMYRPAGQSEQSGLLPGSDYLRLSPYRQLYARTTETVIVRIDTDEGISGWGEAQAPVGPEVVQSIIVRILAPLLVDQDPLPVAVRFDEMFNALRVRGHGGGFYMDAIAGVDTALWDVKGKALGQSLADLLGGARRSELAAYASGLRGSDVAARCETARERAEIGLGTKAFVGFGVGADIAEIEALREAVGPDAELHVDALWRYSLGDAKRLAPALVANHIGFFEAPMDPEDILGHAELRESTTVPIAVGEAMRSRFTFQDWIIGRAMGVCQPDLMRNGVTETVRIATLAEANHMPIGLHVGACTIIGMAATWQVAATLDNFLVQEHQPVMFDRFNPWLTEPLLVRNGRLVVPNGHGLGIEVDREMLMRDVISAATVNKDGTVT